MDSVITMRGIADLAHVARTTVSTWRQRYGAQSETPFPQPVRSSEGSSAQALFNPLEVANWLVETGHGHNSEAVEDAPFYSSLFDFVLKQPISAADLLQRWDEHTPDGSDLSMVLSQLVEAAFGPRPVLERLHDRLLLDSPDKLHDTAMNIITSALAAIIDAHPNKAVSLPTVVPWGPGSVPLLAKLGRNYDDDLPFEVACCFETGSSLAEAVALRELGMRQMAQSCSEYPSDAIIVGVWLGSRATSATQFFDELEDALDGLDPNGAIVIIAPAELLLDQGEAAAVRKRFLSNTATGYVAPLRYSARLPRSWAVNLGQRQLALWIFKRPRTSEKASFPVAIAELSGLTAKHHSQLVSDVAAVVLAADDMAKHVFFNARHSTSTAAWRDGKLTLDAWAVENTAPRRVVGDLLALANTAGLQLTDMFELEDDNTDNPTLERITWKQATTGRNRVLDIVSGTRIADEELKDRGEGTVAVIGPQELTGQVVVGERRIDRLRLEEVSSNAELTEPGDVVFVKGKNPTAMIDHEGGHVVQSPARIARCRAYQGRSLHKLDKVTTPYFTKKAIDSATSSDTSAWLVAVVEQAQLEVLTHVHQRAQARREELQQQLAALDQCESGLATAVASGGVRAGPKVAK